MSDPRDNPTTPGRPADADRPGEDAAFGPDAALERAAPPPDPPSSGELDALFRRVEGAVSTERGVRAWLRSRATPTRWALAAALVGALVVADLLLKPRADIAVYPALRMALALGAMGLLTFLALGVGLRPLQRPAGSRRLTAAILLAGALVPLALALLPPAHGAHPASLVGAGDDLVPWALKCFGFGAVLGVPVVLLLLLLDRGGHVSAWRALAAALAAGLAANLALQVHCPIVHPVHLVLGHASLAFVYPALYVAFSRFVARRAAIGLGPRPVP